MSGTSISIIGAVWLLLASFTGWGMPSASGIPTHQETASRPISNGAAPVSKSEGREYRPTIVIGFVGGFVGHENAVHSPVQVGQRLKKEYPEGVYMEMFENRRREDAHRKILEVLRKGKPGITDGKSVASNGKGATLSDDEKKDAKIIIYGMSWGGSETVALARELEAEKIPVQLTIQVDSVAKVGQNDGVIPANVAEAANFYQTDGLLHGRTEIRAADAKKTRILGNFHYEYKKKSMNCEKYPWWDRLFTKYHTEIECDPEVWGRVEAMIRGKLAKEKETDSAAH